MPPVFPFAVHHAAVKIVFHASLAVRNAAIVDLSRVSDGSTLGVDVRHLDGVHGVLEPFWLRPQVPPVVGPRPAEGGVARGITVEWEYRPIFFVKGCVVPFQTLAFRGGSDGVRTAGNSHGRSRLAGRTPCPFGAGKRGGIPGERVSKEAFSG